MNSNVNIIKCNLYHLYKMHSYVQPYEVESTILNYPILSNKPSYIHILYLSSKWDERIINSDIYKFIVTNENKLHTHFSTQGHVIIFFLRKKNFEFKILKYQTFIFILNVQKRKVPNYFSPCNYTSCWETCFTVRCVSKRMSNGESSESMAVKNGLYAD